MHFFTKIVIIYLFFPQNLSQFMNFFQKNFAIQNYIYAKFWTFEDDKKRQDREYCDQAVSTGCFTLNVAK